MQDRQIKKQDLKNNANLGWSTISKISSNKDVSMEVLKKICEYAGNKGVKIISLYVFSTENFKREKTRRIFKYS